MVQSSIKSRVRIKTLTGLAPIDLNKSQTIDNSKSLTDVKDSGRYSYTECSVDIVRIKKDRKIQRNQ